MKNVPSGLPRRLTDFFADLKKLFKKRQSPSNLLPSQRNCLCALKDSEQLAVLASNKNLGPAIMDKRRYVQRAFTDHLRDSSTYTKISQETATTKIEGIKKKIASWLRKYKDDIPKKEKSFIRRSTSS